MSMLDIKPSRSFRRNKDEILDLVKGSATVKFTMNMPVTLHRDFKALAAQKGVKMTDIINTILLNYIKEELNM